MNSLFGLGIVIDYQDKATAGLLNTEQVFNRVHNSAEDLVNSMDSQMNSLGNLSMQYSSYLYAGQNLINKGRAITDVFAELGKTVVDTGAYFEETRITLEALYKNKEIAEEKLKWAVDFGARTPFDIKDVTGLMVGMKAAGVEIDKEVTSVGGHTQELLGYIGDLAALRPDVGMARMGYAIRNALGGNTRSLVAALDVNVDELLGRKFGAGGAETVAQDIADLVEAMGAEGLMVELFGTWRQMLSEIGDQTERIKLAIADAGAFDGAKDILKKLFDMISLIDDDEIQALGENLSGIFTSILKPVGFLVDMFVVAVNKLKDLIIFRPDIVKIIAIFVAAAGAVLTFIGGLVTLGGILGIARIGLSQLALTLTKFAIGLGMNATGVLSITKVLGFLALKFITLAALAGFLKLAWDNDFAGIRTILTNFGKGALQVLSDVILLIGAFAEAFKDDTISSATFEKLNERGLIPLLETFLELKWRTEAFVEGVIKGFIAVGDTLREVGKKIYDTFNFGGVLDKAREFFLGLFGGKTLKADMNLDGWTDLGERIGKIATSLLLLKFAAKGLPFVKGALSGIASIGSKLGGKNKKGLLPALMGDTKDGGMSKGLFTRPMDVLKNMNSLAIIIGSTLIVITAMGAFMRLPYAKEFLATGGETLTQLLKSILPLAAVALGMAVVVKALSALKINPSDILKGFGKIALIIGGISVLVVALGAFSSIPGVDIFLSRGAETIDSLANILERMFSGKLIASIALITAFGIVPVPTVLTGIANLALILGGMTALISAFSLLASIDGFDDFIARGGESLANLFSQLGLVIGSIIGGFAEGLTSGLPGIGTNLAKFAENAKPFFEVTSEVDTSGVASFIDALSQLVKISALDKLAEFFFGSTDLEGLGRELSNFARSSKGFFEEVATFPEAGMMKAKTVFESISEIGNYSFKSGGIAQLFTGEVSLSRLGTELSKFGTNVKPFFSSVAEIDYSGLSKASSVFSSIEGMKGITSLASQSNGKLKKFGEELVSFGKSLVTFSESSGSIKDMSNISEATKALTTIVKTDITGLVTHINTSTTAINTTITASLNEASTSIQSTMNTIKSDVSTSIRQLEGYFRNASFQFPRNIKLPRFSMSGGFSVEPPRVPKVSVSWYAKGGVFDSPSIIGVGEEGKEAVMPLERNTAWIDDLASKLNSSSSRDKGTSSIDNSITVEHGAIQITMTDGNSDEIDNLVDELFAKIERKRQLKETMNYKPIPI